MSKEVKESLLYSNTLFFGIILQKYCFFPTNPLPDLTIHI